MRKIWVLNLIIMLTVIANIQPSHAIPTLSLSDGTSTVLVEDGSSLDFVPLAGVVGFNGTVGSFTGNVTVGLTYPLIGTLADPEVDLCDISWRGIGTLTLMYSDIGFGIPSDYDFYTAVGGVTGGKIKVASYIDTNNTLFIKEIELSSMGPFHGAFCGSDEDLINLSGSFSVTTSATITHTNICQVSSFDLFFKGDSRATPEPSTLILFMLGGGALLKLRKR